MTTALDALMTACVKVGGPKSGTGYLIAPDRVATCHHVVDLWDEGEAYPVEIGYPDPIHCEAKLKKRDKASDCAIIAIEPAVDVAPLPLADGLAVQAPWEGYGFPHSAKGVGTYMKGEVLVPKSKDETGRPIIQLFSQQAAAGAAAPLHGFSGTPVLVAGAVVGHVIRHVGDPDDRKRPAFGAVYAAPVAGVTALLDDGPAPRKIHPATLVPQDAFIDEIREHGARTVRELDAPKDETLRAAKILIGRNRPDLAQELLEAKDQESLQIKQMLALAIAKTGRTEDAIALLKTLVEQGHEDHETLGLLAGRYKDLWRDRGDRATLLASHRIYFDAFEATGDGFNGINAAATALWLGDRVETAVLAARTIESFCDKENLDHWSLATIAEAWLLQGKLEKASEWYGRAVAEAPELYQDIAVMRRQARLNLKHLGKPEDALDDVLPVPGVLAFAGHMLDEPGRDPPRFPDEKIGRVRLAIRDKLEELGFVQGFGTAARGSDILFLEEMVRRRVRPIVVLPFPEEDFRRISVGGEWDRRLDVIRDKLEVLVLEPDAPPDAELPQTFEESNAKIFQLAREHAKGLGEPPRLLAVWDGEPKGDGPGGTADAVRLWRDEGSEPIIIDINAV